MDLNLLLQTALVTTICLSLLTCYTSYNERRKVQRLGAYAPSVTPWWSLGLSFVLDIFRYSSVDENVKFAHNYFSKDATSSTYRETFEVRMVGTRYIFTANFENIKAMLATRFLDFGKGERFKKDWAPILGNSIFAVDGDLWHSERRLLNSVLTKQRLSDLTCFETYLQKVIPLLGQEGSVDVKNLFSRLALDIQADFTMNKAMNTIEEPDSRFTSAFEAALGTQALIEKTGPLNFLIPRRKFLADVRWIRNAVAPIVDDVLAIPMDQLQDLKRDDEKCTFLHECAHFTRDPALITDQILSILFAGRDTIAMTLTWVFYELAKNPELVEDLRAEIEAMIGWNQRPDYNDLKGMKLVQYTLNEALRLYPAIPLNGRVALRDTTLPFGGGQDGSQPVGVPKGTNIYYNTHILHLNEDMYPATSKAFPPPHLFRPKRWYHWQPKPWTYLPFHGGPRICIGQNYALTQMSYHMVRILQTFRRIELDSTMHEAASSHVSNQPWARSNGRMSMAEKFVRETPTMALEVILFPRSPVNLRFYR